MNAAELAWSGKKALAEGADVALALGQLMAAAGVEGHPRNYEIFYQAYVDSNEPLRTALEGLGSNPSQEKLDHIAATYGDETEFAGMIGDAHDRMSRMLGELMALASAEQDSLAKFVTLLDTTVSGMGEEREVSRELLQRVVAILSSATKATVQNSRKNALSMEAHSGELKAIRQELETYKNLADTDPLTGLLNRRAFNRVMARIYGSRHEALLNSLILFDIDRFKDLNDRFGHLVGDKVLVRVAEIMQSKCASHVSLFRIGGEEFALVVEGLTDASTRKLGDEIRLAVKEHSFADLAQIADVTISGGICKMSDAGGSEDLFAKADSALYASKSQGRNRITSYPLADMASQRKNWLIYSEG